MLYSTLKGDKMKFKTEKGYMGNVVFQGKMLLNAISLLEGLSLKLYILLAVLCTEKNAKDIDFLTEKLNTDRDSLISALSSLDKNGFIKFSSDSVTLKYIKQEDNFIVKPEISPDTVKEISDKEMKELISAGEKCFKKLLSVKEVDTLVSVRHYYNIDVSVLTIMLSYIEGLERKSMAYFEKVAIDWYEKGIDTPQKAHTYVKELEENNIKHRKIASLLGIYNRSLTKKEKEFSEKWVGVFSDDEIKAAYEKTVDSTGKVSFAYMNKILNGDGEPEKKSQKRVKPSKFNNFTQTGSSFADIKKKKFENILNTLKENEDEH